jgi:hypothetical protein
MPRKDEPMAHDDSTNAWPAIDEAVEPGLLLKEVLSGGLGGLLLQGQLHALVAAILLRPARLDAFDVNAEP